MGDAVKFVRLGTGYRMVLHSWKLVTLKGRASTTLYKLSPRISPLQLLLCSLSFERIPRNLPNFVPEGLVPKEATLQCGHVGYLHFVSSKDDDYHYVCKPQDGQLIVMTKPRWHVRSNMEPYAMEVLVTKY